jgi:hypothetical protein
MSSLGIAYMKKVTSQPACVSRGSSSHFPQLMHPAFGTREKLWKGLERYVNCSDSEDDYRALSRSFPGFWPLGISYYPDPEEVDIASLNWDPACHKLFLFYRDRLRKQWEDIWEDDELGPEFFLGLGSCNWNEIAIESAERDLEGNRIPDFPDPNPFGQLLRAWWEILSHFPEAFISFDAPCVRMIWEFGNFYLDPKNDFQSAFLMLFRQSWRARVCPRCKTYFIARKPKQTFCGTACSAGSRLASNRNWWNRIGAKRRAAQTRIQKGQSHTERKRR